MSCTRITLALCLASLLIAGRTSTVAASASPARPLPPPLAALVVTGPGVVSEVQLQIACEDVSSALPAARCSVVARFELNAVDALELRDVRRRLGLARRHESHPGGTSTGDRVWVDGAPLVEARTLAPGERVQVELATTRLLHAYEGRAGSPWFLAPMRLRHMFFGGGLSRPRSGDSLEGRLLEGDTVRLRGPVHVALRTPDFVRARVDGVAVGADADVDGAHLHLALTLDLPWHEPARWQVGGPLLGLGARWARVQHDAARPLLRLGYEWSVARYLFASVNLESDFDSLLESVVIEVASPLLLLFPGVAVGVGVAARQFGPDRADAALRFRLGAQLPILGVTADFDYWPSRQEWSGSLSARVSL